MDKSFWTYVWLIITIEINNTLPLQTHVLEMLLLVMHQNTKCFTTTAKPAGNKASQLNRQHMPWGCGASLWDTLRAQLRLGVSPSLDGWELTHRMYLQRLSTSLCTLTKKPQQDLSAVFNSYWVEGHEKAGPGSSQGSTRQGWDSGHKEIPPWHFWFRFCYFFYHKLGSTTEADV